jgi:hypothetical protein
MPRRKTPSPQAPVPPPADALPSMFTGGTVRWSGVDATALRACIDAASGQGHAVMFSKTSDGGSLAMTCMIGASRPVKYFQHVEDADSFLREWTEWLVANAES